MGFFSGGRFNLVISFRYSPAVNEMTYWCQFMQQVSRILHDATDGAHSIGTVLMSANSMGGADADIWVHPDAAVWPNSTAARLWFPRESIDVSQDYMYYATVLAHELCHYLYDLRDEYNNGTSCQGNIATEASMMEGYNWDNYTRWINGAGNDYVDWPAFWADFQAGTAQLQLGQPTEFCHAGNHNATANNNQNNLNGNQSCWTYIANDANHNAIPYGLAVPGAGGPALAAPAFPADTVCTELIPVQRFMLVLDRSGSMTGVKLDQMKVGANFWVDYVNPGEEFGLVSYSTTPSLDSAMSEAPAAGPASTTWRNDRHTIVDNMTAGGVTAIGDALRTGLNSIIAGGRASSQVMVLFTDGLQNWGAETAEAVLPDLIASGVRCYTIGLGNDQDAALLANIANSTGATYFGIDGDLDAAEAAAAITEALIQIAGESRENGGIVSFQDVDGASVDAVAAEDPARPPFAWTPEGEKPTPVQPGKPIEKFRFPVRIAPGSTHCTLGALWKYTRRTFRVRVLDPGGHVVPAGADVRFVSGKRPYSFYEIDHPMPGTWLVEIIGSGIRQTKFRTIGFEVNGSIRLELSARETHIRAGKDINLRARLLAPQPVPGARMRGWIRSPAGVWTQFRFVEHKDPKADGEEPLLYTARLKTKEAQRGHYLICVDAARAKGTFTLELDEMYRRKPGLSPAAIKQTISIPAIARRAFLTVAADREGPSGKEPLAGFNPRDPWIPRNQKALLERWKKAHKK